ncbi:MAG: hypothetical protein H7210_04365 [Pyrinomonadaceae bacterium]|nr:hypothetical protein [Phycisphaerales bacterium]
MRTRLRILTLTCLAAGGSLLGSAASAQTVFYSENFNSAVRNQLSGDPCVATACSTAVWTETPPAGWIVDDSLMPTYRCRVLGDCDGSCSASAGVLDWEGWAFASKTFWISADDQRRSEFALGQNTVAIADPDEWDDAGGPVGACGYFHAFMTSAPVSIGAIDTGSLAFRFDSSWRDECCDDGEDASNNQTATIVAIYTVGSSTIEVEILRWESTMFLADGFTPNPNFHDDLPNESVTLTNAQLQAPVGATSVRFKFGLSNAGNDWWWAIDNLAVEATVASAPTILWSENFDSLPLGASPEEAGGAGCSTYCGVHTFTHTGPNGVTIDSSLTPAGGVPDWRGWSLVDPVFWNSVAGQDRNLFTSGTGLIAVADGDEWTDRLRDIDQDSPMITFLETPAFSIAARCGDSMIVSFDSSWNDEPNQTASITVSFDGAAPQAIAMWSSVIGHPDYRAGNLNERVNIPVVIPSGSTTARINFGYTGHNNWWWAIDNVSVFEGQVDLVASQATPRRDLMALAPNVNFQPCFGPWTPTPPANWAVDNSQMSAGGVEEWFGWNIAHREWWSNIADNQGRAEFTLGDSYIAIADPDEWDDVPSASPFRFNSFLTTPVIALSSNNNVEFSFDSSWRDECCDDDNQTNNQTATIVAAYTVGNTTVNVEVVRWESNQILPDMVTPNPNFKNDAPNEHVSLNTAALHIPVGATAVQFKFGLTNAANDWWWAIDDVKVVVNNTVAFNETFDNPVNAQIPPTEQPPSAFNPSLCFYFSTVAGQSSGYVVDNSNFVAGPLTLEDFVGWNAWLTEAWWRSQGGLRSQFGSITSYVSDFAAAQGAMGMSILTSPPLDVRDFNAGTLAVSFRSGWVAAPLHVSNVQVSYDNGPWINVLTWNADAPPQDPTRKVTNTDQVVTVNLNNSATANSARIRFVDGSSGWWAISNISVLGSVGTPRCLGDWNNDCTLNSQDFFDFLSAFFANNADFNNDTFTNSQDFFDFLVAFFAGC